MSFNFSKGFATDITDEIVIVIPPSSLSLSSCIYVNTELDFSCDSLERTHACRYARAPARLTLILAAKLHDVTVRTIEGGAGSLNNAPI